MSGLRVIDGQAEFPQDHEPQPDSASDTQGRRIRFVEGAGRMTTSGGSDTTPAIATDENGDEIVISSSLSQTTRPIHSFQFPSPNPQLTAPTTRPHQRHLPRAALLMPTLAPSHPRTLRMSPMGPTEAAALHNHLKGGGHRRRMTVEDPGAYRPSTPILNWEGPKRSSKPPKLKLWVSLSLMCAAQLLILGLLPPFMSTDQLYVFLSVFIPGFTMITGLLTYLSMTRHVNKLAKLLVSINNPMDMDRVVEFLQQGRFSRFEETWKLQVESIRMFCRLLKYHHGVNPVSGEFLENSVDDDMLFSESSASRTYSWRHHQPNAAGVSVDGGPVENELANSWAPNNRQTMYLSGVPPNFDEAATMYSCGSPTLPTGIGFPREEGEFAPCAFDHIVSSEKINHSNKRKSLNHGRFSRSQSYVALDEVPPETSADPLGDNEQDWKEVLGAPPEDQRSLVLTFLRNMKPDVELSKTPLPVQVLEPRSLLEKLSDLFVHPRAFANISRVTPGQDRLVAILKWFFSAYHVKPTGAKKPFNPVLGESFECYFAKGTEDEVHYFAEQVSHHPPITVFTVVHTASKVTLTCGFYPKPKLVSPNMGGSIVDGRVEIRVPASGLASTAGREEELWVLNLPSAYIGGLLTGTMRVELGGEVKITSSSSEFSSSFSFEMKGWLSGDYDVIKGVMTKGNVTLRSIEGKWSSVVKLVDKRNNAEEEILFDLENEPPMRPFAPLVSIGSKPSRQLWKHVTTAVRAGDSTLAQKAKEKLEDSQRQERRAREAHGKEYFPAHFRLVAAKKKPSETQWVYTGPVSL